MTIRNVSGVGCGYDAFGDGMGRADNDVVWSKIDILHRAREEREEQSMAMKEAIKVLQACGLDGVAEEVPDGGVPGDRRKEVSMRVDTE